MTAAVVGCSGGDDGSSGSHLDGSGGQDFGNSKGITSAPMRDGGPAHPMINQPPPTPLTGFTDTEVGGYKLGPALENGAKEDAGTQAQSEASGCSVMIGIVRDFKGSNEQGGHPDFESFMADHPTPRLVAQDLGADSKPVYASHCEAMPDMMLCPYGQMTTSKEAFDQWYRSTPGVNEPYIVYLKFAQNGDVFTFESNNFFPLDPTGHLTKNGHDYGFTTELHAEFQYHGGEQFTFTGDDDLWVFVNGKLAIDLGGLHPSASSTLDLDHDKAKLGIEKGNMYHLDFFHAERHTDASNFRVDTTLGFTDCGKITPEVI
jgi:fibro-slime domain-containing protein